MESQTESFLPSISPGNGFHQLLLFSFVMCLGSYIFGSLPLYLPLSEDKLEKVSIFGAGLLLGTALAVIIPEGLQTLLLSSSSKMENIDKGVGVSLVFGFLFMLLIDQIAKGFASKSLESDNNSRKKPVNWTTTLGLVVHGAVDGVALGAAALTNQTDVELIVFFAIMLHKAPASFGLVTFLLHEGLDRTRTRKHLLLFSLSAPLLSLLTFVCLSSGTNQNSGSTLLGTGYAMLFSSGTFLYVATVHVLPSLRSSGVSVEKGWSPLELLCLCSGSLCPLLLTLSHSHSHN